MAEKIFVDTNPIIYLVGEEQPYYEKVLAYLSDGIRSNAEFYTSTVTDAEFLVVPFRKNDKGVQDAYWNLMKRLNVTRIPIGGTVAETAARLRAKYGGVKLRDIRHLGIGTGHNGRVHKLLRLGNSHPENEL